MKKSLVLALTLAMLSGVCLSACNTTQGLGKDVSQTGNDISNEAAKDK